LYALRGVLQAGATERAMAFLKYYSRRRLLGEHVPYPVEAYPEGNQRQLSAESGLYCRIFTEGLFGIRPTGFKTFDCTPRLPKEWDHMALNNIHSFASIFDLKISREKGGEILIRVLKGSDKHVYKLRDGETAHIQL
jgi:cellobiose phosphorylase